MVAEVGPSRTVPMDQTCWLQVAVTTNLAKPSGDPLIPFNCRGCARRVMDGMATRGTAF